MQIILLSGGSGKRLWPLSNDTRSKQFLQLLQTPAGRPESMVQRVVRQISESEITDNITVATSESQKDFIATQLGQKVTTVTEPSRRDTFPAIVLSSAYLAMEKGCKRDEVIVVMPCDTYTDSEYFEIVHSMSSLVEHGVANLVLMGIAPTVPSTKFGYVVASPANENGVFYNVERFIEKSLKEVKDKMYQLGLFFKSYE